MNFKIISISDIVEAEVTEGIKLCSLNKYFDLPEGSDQPYHSIFVTHADGNRELFGEYPDLYVYNAETKHKEWIQNPQFEESIAHLTSYGIPIHHA